MRLSRCVRVYVRRNAFKHVCRRAHSEPGAKLSRTQICSIGCDLAGIKAPSDFLVLFYPKPSSLLCGREKTLNPKPDSAYLWLQDFRILQCLGRLLRTSRLSEAISGLLQAFGLQRVRGCFAGWLLRFRVSRFSREGSFTTMILPFSEYLRVLDFRLPTYLCSSFVKDARLLGRSV